MKEEDCNKTQIFYPKTKRCIKKDTKKAIEYLFNKGDKTINEIYEKVDGKIVKRCEKDKIRNPDTKRCIKTKIIKKMVNKEVKINLKSKRNVKDKIKKVSASLNTKIDAIKKVKKALLPFINRVSADIYHRNKYLVLMRRELRKYNRTNEGCLKIYKKNPDGTFSYRIGNRLILKKRIGSDSVYGIVYLSEFREKEKKMFTYASKVYEYVPKKAKMELELLNKLTNIVRMDMCPHFPILYGYVLCKKFLNNQDSFIKSKEEDKTISQNIRNFPELVRLNKSSIIITTFNELANGDLWNFLKIYNNNIKLLANAIIQKFISIMFFNYYTNRAHMDTHPGNFLYHKIKAGGYFHYELFGVDYYLENIGILWVIWDFDLSLKIKEALQYINIARKNNDYIRILKAYYSHLLGGYCNDPKIYNNQSLFEFTKLIYNNNIENFKNGHNINSMKEYIYNLPLLLSNIKLDGNKIFLTELPKTAKIINKNPYKMVREELFNKI